MAVTGGAKLSIRPQISTIDTADYLYIVDADETPGLAQSKRVLVSQLDSRFLVDSSTPVTLAGSLDYLTLSGQQITRNAIDLTTDITGALAITNGGSGQTTAQAAIDALTQVGAATDEHVLTKDTASGNATWKAAAGGATPTSDTRANILASTPTTTNTAKSSDSNEFFFYDGATWYSSPLELQAEDNTPDMGLQPPLVVNDRAGYSADYITDKTLHNIRILENALTAAGAARTTTGGTFEVYLNGVWNEVVINFRLREDDSGAYEFEHKPIGFTEWYEIMSGNSNTLGLNGLPIIQQYEASMGAYPVHLQVVGRSFD